MSDTFGNLTMYQNRLAESKKILGDLKKKKAEIDSAIEGQTQIVQTNQEQFNEWLQKLVNESKGK